MFSTAMTLLSSLVGAALAGTGVMLLRLRKRDANTGSRTGSRTGRGTRSKGASHRGSTSHPDDRQASDRGRRSGGGRQRASRRKQQDKHQPSERRRKIRAYVLLGVGLVLVVLPWLFNPKLTEPVDPEDRAVDVEVLLDQPVPPGGLPYSQGFEAPDPTLGKPGTLTRPAERLEILILAWATPSPLDAAPLIEVQKYTRKLAVKAAAMAKTHWRGSTTDIRLLSRTEFRRLEAQPKALIDWCDTVAADYLVVLGVGPHRESELNLDKPRTIIMELHDCEKRRSARQVGELDSDSSDRFLYETALQRALRGLMVDGFQPRAPASKSAQASPTGGQEDPK